MVIENLHNCNQYWVEPPVDGDGKPREGQWLDEGRLTVIGEGITAEEVKAPKRGSIFQEICHGKIIGKKGRWGK